MSNIESKIRGINTRLGGDSLRLPQRRNVDPALRVLKFVIPFAGAAWLSRNALFSGDGAKEREKRFNELKKRLKDAGLDKLPLNGKDADAWVRRFYAVQEQGKGDIYTPAQLAILTQMSALQDPRPASAKRTSRALGQRLRRNRTGSRRG